MLHLLIHAQFGYLIHPSIQLPTMEEGGEPLRIADVGTGTGYIDLPQGRLVLAGWFFFFFFFF